MRIHVRCAADGVILAFSQRLTVNQTGNCDSGDCSGCLAVVDLLSNCCSDEGQSDGTDARRSLPLLTAGCQGIVARGRAVKGQISDGDDLVLARILVGKRAGGGNGQSIVLQLASEERLAAIQRGDGSAVVGLVIRGNAGNGDGLFRHRQRVGCCRAAVVVRSLSRSGDGNRLCTCRQDRHRAIGVHGRNIRIAAGIGNRALNTDLIDWVGEGGIAIHLVYGGGCEGQFLLHRRDGEGPAITAYVVLRLIADACGHIDLHRVSTGVLRLFDLFAILIVILHRNSAETHGLGCRFPCNLGGLRIAVVDQFVHGFEGKIIGFQSQFGTANGKLPVLRRQFGGGFVVRALGYIDLDGVFARVLRRGFLTVFIVVFYDDIVRGRNRCALDIAVIGQACRGGEGEVLRLGGSFANGIGHAGGGAAHGDAGGVLARVLGERAVFQCLWTIHAHLCVADGDPTRRRALPIAACSHRGGFAFPAVGQLGGGLDGHAAAVRAGASRVCAACGDGRAACRVRPAMLMPGHGERLAVALVAVVAPHINAVLVAAVFRQIADGERLALPAGMRRSINIAECRGPVVL